GLPQRARPDQHRRNRRGEVVGDRLRRRRRAARAAGHAAQCRHAAIDLCRALRQRRSPLHVCARGRFQHELPAALRALHGGCRRHRRAAEPGRLRRPADRAAGDGNSDTMSRKPELSFWQIWNMCFGFLGIQFGFALQNANVSRIFQTLGAGVGDIPALWIAAPLTGLIVQPLIGHWSDRTWGRLGRRRPYFLVGAVLATLALFAMPDAPLLWIAAGLLWVMDASFNIAMEPFRAFVGDQLPTRQRAK